MSLPVARIADEPRITPLVLRESGARLFWFPQGTRTDIGTEVSSDFVLFCPEIEEDFRILRAIGAKVLPFLQKDTAIIPLQQRETLVRILKKWGLSACAQAVRQIPAGTKEQQSASKPTLVARQEIFLAQHQLAPAFLANPLTFLQQEGIQIRIQTNEAHVFTEIPLEMGTLARVADQDYWVVPRKAYVSLAKKLPFPLNAHFLLSTLFDWDTKTFSTAATYADLPVEQETIAREKAKKLLYRRGQNPREYQILGVLALRHLNYRAILADAPGLGKTAQVCLALASDWKQLLPAIIVAPASVLLNWEREIRRWAPWLPVRVIRQTEKLPVATPLQITVITWDLLPKMENELRRLGAKSLVLDEAHYAKNGTTKRGLAVRALAALTPHRILLTGTPLENRPLDLWHLLHLVDPGSFPSKEAFSKLLQQSDLYAINAMLKRWVIRRTKEQVLPELPEKIREYQWVTLPAKAQELYRQAEEATLEVLRREYANRVFSLAGARFQAEKPALCSPEQKRRLLRKCWEETPKDAIPEDLFTADVLRKFGLLRRLVGVLKVASVIRFILSLRESVIVFAEHRRVVAMLQRACERAGKRVAVIDGGTSAALRQASVDAFQQGAVDVIIGTQAMHAGVTLTRSSLVVFAERWWVPAREEQAEDRAHRMGQKGEIVRCVYFGAINTIDERLHSLIEEKRAVADTIVDGELQQVEASVQQHVAPIISASLAQRMLEYGGPLTFEAFVRFCWEKGWV